MKVGELKINYCPPYLYHWFVRPQLFTKKYIHQPLQQTFQFEGRKVLDFGSGTGANCTMFEPEHYIGMEPDGDRVAFSQKRYPQHTFSVLDSNKLQLEEGSIDYILIIAVLHHIPTQQISDYMNEFKRVLKKNGTIVVIEPYLDPLRPICNFLMKKIDNGLYIRSENEYLNLFSEHDLDCRVVSRFKKCFLYNELFFTVHPKL